VKTIRELIYWEYAKLIAKAARFDKNYGFIMSKFKKLKNNHIRISDISEDDEEAMMMERVYAYCGSKEDLSVDHIISLIKGGPDITSNKILCCKICNASKLDKDIFEWYYLIKKE
jgi:5-methylcytosine-specific restriction endonuclease McrA